MVRKEDSRARGGRVVPFHVLVAGDDLPSLRGTMESDRQARVALADGGRVEGGGEAEGDAAGADVVGDVGGEGGGGEAEGAEGGGEKGGGVIAG